MQKLKLPNWETMFKHNYAWFAKREKIRKWTKYYPFDIKLKFEQWKTCDKNKSGKPKLAFWVFEGYQFKTGMQESAIITCTKHTHIHIKTKTELTDWWYWQLRIPHAKPLNNANKRKCQVQSNQLQLKRTKQKKNTPFLFNVFCGKRYYMQSVTTA